MVKLSGFADEIAPDAKTQIATLNKTGVRHIELRGVEGKGVLDLTADEVASFRGQLQEADIGVSSIGSPIGKVQIRADLEEHFARFEIALQRAREFAAPYVRVFSFSAMCPSAAPICCKASTVRICALPSTRRTSFPAGRIHCKKAGRSCANTPTIFTSKTRSPRPGG